MVWCQIIIVGELATFCKMSLHFYFWSCGTPDLSFKIMRSEALDAYNAHVHCNLNEIWGFESFQQKLKKIYSLYRLYSTIKHYHRRQEFAKRVEFWTFLYFWNFSSLTSNKNIKNNENYGYTSAQKCIFAKILTHSECVEFNIEVQMT